jgi:hypothetical protein
MRGVFLFFAVVLSMAAMAQPERIIYPRVNVFNPDGTIRTRGNIVEVSGSTYKIHVDGCNAEKDFVVDTSLTKPVFDIPKDDSSLAVIHGRWDLRRFEYPADYKWDGKEAPLQINPTGTYVWYDVYGKPAIISGWYQYPKLPGATKGADAYNCIVIMDRFQQFYRTYVGPDNKLHIQRFCNDTQVTGERIE